MNRAFIRRLHPIAGIIALLLILSFWSSTLFSEVFGNHQQIFMVKSYILFAIWIVIPCMMITAISGSRLAGKSQNRTIAIKRKRMIWAAGNALFILIPCAFYLHKQAALAQFNSHFIVIQGVELLAGAINIILITCNIYDGIMLSRSHKR